MKNINSILIAFATIVHGYLDQNVLCGDSGECAADCLGGAYKIVTENQGAPFFGCSLKANTMDYYRVGCPARDEPTRRGVCDAVAGKFCPTTLLSPISSCVIVSKDLVKYSAACKSQGEDRNIITGRGPYAAAVEGCDES